MKHAEWIAGGVALAALVLLKRPASAIAQTTLEVGPSPLPIDNGTTAPTDFQNFKQPSLPGYSRMRAADVPASLLPRLRPLLAAPLGTVTKLPTEGRDIAAVIEPHFHEPGGPVKPWGWHKGVSLYERKGANA